MREVEDGRRSGGVEGAELIDEWMEVMDGCDGWMRWVTEGY